MNGTAFSAGLTALVVRNAESIGVLSAVLTALAVEAMIGARGSFDPFVGEARPHVGQIEAAHLVHTLLAGSRFATDHEEEARIEEDDGILRQDRWVCFDSLRDDDVFEQTTLDTPFGQHHNG